MQLLLIRHADAVDPDAASSDFDRALTPTGRRQFEQLATFLIARGVRPGIVLHSPLLRATQTAEILGECAELAAEQVQMAPFLYPGLSLEALCVELSQVEEDCVALVAHEPDISGSTSRLVGGGRFRFHPGSIACLQFAGRPSPDAGFVRWVLSAALFAG